MHFLFVAATAAEWQGAWPESTRANLPERQLNVFNDAQGRQHAVLITGVGPINAAMSLGHMLEEARQAKAVINVGIAGSFDLTTAPLGSVWRVHKEIWPEYGLATDFGVDAQGLGFPLWRNAEDKPVWDRLELPHPGSMEALTEGTWPKATACSLTVAGVTNSAERAARLHAHYAQGQVLLENMEGFALALICAQYSLPFLELRVVSNLVGSRAPEHRAFGPALAALSPLVNRILS